MAVGSTLCVAAQGSRTTAMRFTASHAGNRDEIAEG
jgi:hypothetical protein